MRFRVDVAGQVGYQTNRTMLSLASLSPVQRATGAAAPRDPATHLPTWHATPTQGDT